MDITITNTSETFETWLEKDFIEPILKQTLSKASILIIPFEDLREAENPIMFPIGTEELLRYMEAKLPQDFNVDICISDELYQEFEFNNDYKKLGKFIIKSVAVPFFVTVFSSYVYDKYIKEDKSKPQIEVVNDSNQTKGKKHISTLTDKKYLEPTHIDFSVTIEDSLGRSKNISYEGPASEIQEVLKSLKEYEEQ
ncbi:hypothetical protein [Flammeovirga sp. SJP92]|uniref:hypothetical protein n=1 Tax=Flammeovirga sp. SJP92 TaxID=1775430 RepID=UPI000786ABAA|nr:hypothetical protein [Flammeovirga sp. SJP92]KXX71678.1 hypothetical protein AVL50_05235 [Flammeovirga sp. SJP92]